MAVAGSEANVTCLDCRLAENSVGGVAALLTSFTVAFSLGDALIHRLNRGHDQYTAIGSMGDPIGYRPKHATRTLHSPVADHDHLRAFPISDRD